MIGFATLKYVRYNGVLHKINMKHKLNDDWDAVVDSIKKADEMIEHMRASGHNMKNPIKFDHNVSDDE